MDIGLKIDYLQLYTAKTYQKLLDTTLLTFHIVINCTSGQTITTRSSILSLGMNCHSQKGLAFYEKMATLSMGKYKFKMDSFRPKKL